MIRHARHTVCPRRQGQGASTPSMTVIDGVGTSGGNTTRKLRGCSGGWQRLVCGVAPRISVVRETASAVQIACWIAQYYVSETELIRDIEDLIECLSNWQPSNVLITLSTTSVRTPNVGILTGNCRSWSATVAYGVLLSHAAGTSTPTFSRNVHQLLPCRAGHCVCHDNCSLPNTHW